MVRFLHHVMRENGPGWPGNPLLDIRPLNLIAQGAGSNVYVLSFTNHLGTHMDAPNHYLAQGLKITDLPPEFFVFDAPCLLDIPKTDREKVWPEDLQPHAEAIAACDLLMLRTGFSACRESEPERYAAQGPGISSQAARYLSETFPKLRAIMVDCLSLASYADTADGDETHRWLLGHYADRFICAIEDANLAVLDAPPRRVLVAPLLVERIDSAPVTILAE